MLYRLIYCMANSFLQICEAKDVLDFMHILHSAAAASNLSVLKYLEFNWLHRAAT